MEYSDYIDFSGVTRSGEEEFYELENDPYELKNEINNPNYNALIESFKQEITSIKGIGIKTPIELPIAEAGIQYEIQLEPEGGRGPYIWSLYGSNLPQGLKLTRNGLLSGAYTGRENTQFRVQIIVQDSKISSYTNQPNFYIRDF